MSKVENLKEKILYAEDYLIEIKQELKHVNSNRKPTVKNKIRAQKLIIKDLKEELKRGI